MINSVKLVNFKTFDEETFNMAPLTVVSGLNGMGKSTLLQSLLVIRQNFAMDYFNSAQTKVRLEGPIVDLEDCASLCYAMAEDKTVMIELRDEKGETVQVSIDASIEEEKMPNCIITGSASSFVQYFDENMVFFSADRIGPRKNYNKQSARSHNTRFGVEGELIPAFLDAALRKRESVELLDLAIGKTQDESGKEIIDTSLVSNVNAWLSNIMNVSVGAETKEVDKDTVHMDFKFNDVWGTKFSAMQVGFGYSYALPIIVAVLASKPGTIIMVENPEAHLHPSAQVKLGEFLAKAASLGLQIIVETHSDHFLNGLRLARKNAYCAKDDIRLMFVQRDSTDGQLFSYTSEIMINDDGKFSEALPKMFNTWSDVLIQLI